MLFKKQDNLRYVFVYKSSDNLHCAIFQDFFNWHLLIYKKHNTLSYVTFLHTKRKTFKKSKTIGVTVLNILKADALCCAIFHEIFEIGREGRRFYEKNE